jgi:hypothetical protein
MILVNDFSQRPPPAPWPFPANGTGVPEGNPGDFRRSQALGGLPLNPDAAPKLPSRPESEILPKS